MRGSRPRVYLAGPITGLSYEGATDWREYAKRALAPEVIGVSPMRGKEYLAHLKDIGGTPDEHYMRLQAMSTPKGITNRDRWDCKTCDAILMNVLGATKASVGTMIEAGWANAYGVPVVLVIEAEGKMLNPATQPSPDPALLPVNPHYHSILDQIAAFSVPTLEEAIHILKTMFYS